MTKKVQKNFFAFNAAHDHKDTNVEYLPMSVSSNKKTGTFNVSTLSPFAIVYKDVKKAEPFQTPMSFHGPEINTTTSCLTWQLYF